jgi:hypothetical protein
VREGVLSFTDARFVVSGGGAAAAAAAAAWPRVPADVAALPPGGYQCTVQTEDASALARPFLVHIAAPPDGRYFPQSSSQLPWRLSAFDVLFFPTEGLATQQRSGGNTSSSSTSAEHVDVRVTSVFAVLSCAEQARARRMLWSEVVPLSLVPYPDASSSSSGGTAGSGGSAPQPLRAVGTVGDAARERAVACIDAEHALALQVFVHTAAHGAAASEQRPILAAADAHAASLALGNTALERAVVRTSWPSAAAWAYYGMLAAQIASMLFARLFACQIIAAAEWIERAYLRPWWRTACASCCAVLC